MKGFRTFLRCAVLTGFFAGLAVRAQADPLEPVARELAKGLAGLPGHKVAVVPFEYPGGGISSGSSLVSERLITCLAGRRDVQVVERSLLSKVLQEMKIESSGVTPAAAVWKWGKILAVDAVVTGTLIDVSGSRTEVHARIVQVETGLVLAARTVTIERTWTDRPLVKPLAPVLVQSGRSSQQSPDLMLASDEKTVTQPEAPSMTMPDTDSLIRNPVLPSNSLSAVRRIYDSSPDPRVRAGALYAMGIILERRGLPAEAAQAYRRLIDEFPDNARLKSDAAGRLWATGQN
jgi:TolB-like protein